MKRQNKRIKGREEKIAAVHEGWLVKGKRTMLLNIRHYVHQGKQPFWQGLESFLIDTLMYKESPLIGVQSGDSGGISESRHEERLLRPKSEAFGSMNV